MKQPHPRTLALMAALATAMLGCTEQGTPPAATDPAATATTAAPAAKVSDLKVVQWGPKNTSPGVAFNVQPDGNSGMFVEFDGPLPATKFEGTLGGKPLQGVVASGNVVTATVPADYVAAAGRLPLELFVPSENARISVGEFVVGDEAAAPGAETMPAAPAEGDAPVAPMEGDTPPAEASSAEPTPQA